MKWRYGGPPRFNQSHNRRIYRWNGSWTRLDEVCDRRRGTTATLDPKSGDAVDPVTPLVRAKGAGVGLRTEAIPRISRARCRSGTCTSIPSWFVGDAGTTEPSRPSRRIGAEWSNRYAPRSWLLVDVDDFHFHPVESRAWRLGLRYRL